MAAPRVEPRVAVGEILGCHGLRGELKVRPLTDDPHRFGELERVFLDDEETPREIVGYRVHKGFVLLTIAGCEDRTAAEAYQGRRLTIPRAERRELEEDRWYHDELAGLEVREADGSRIGQVLDFDEASGGGLLEIRLDAGGRLDVPFARVWVPEVDVAGGFLVLAARWRQLLSPED